MSSKRSYLDNLNAGRQRRSGTALEEIHRTLDKLERRLGGALDTRDGNTGSDDVVQCIQRLSEEALACPSAVSERPGAAGMPQALDRITREIEDARRQEDQRASIGNIAAELDSLRGEMRSMVGTSLRTEFDLLREELARIMEAVPQSPLTDELNTEFARLSRTIEHLAERSDDRNTKLLRLELEEAKASLARLTREMTVRSLDQRWSASQDRFPPQAGQGTDPGIKALHARLEAIGAAVNRLPESLSLRSLEERVEALAGSLDRFATQRDPRQPDLRGMIEERLDEISRAIAASAARAAFDPRPLERIEARVTSLANQINELVEDRPGGMIVERLNTLSERVDEIARRIDIPEQAVERLASHIAHISEKLDSAPLPREADSLFRTLEERFADLTRLVQQRQEDALLHSQGLFQDLERRLQDVAERLDRSAAGEGEAALIAAMDSRFAELAARIEDAREPGDPEALRALEARLERFSERLQETAPANHGIDPEIIRNLEAQMAALSAHLTRPGADAPDFEDLAPRLENIERSIGENHTALLEAARRAAEQAVQSMGAAGGELPEGRLRDDLQRLEALARKSEERNSRTFEAIHDTLLKIVERLGSFEGTDENPSKVALSAAPSIDPAANDAISEEEARAGQMLRRTPAEAAAAAAEAALREDEDRSRRRGERQSLLGGISRALAGRSRDNEAPIREEPAVGERDPDESEFTLDAARINEPLEPGSGAPDLNAIMRRVRDERGRDEAQHDDTAKADFIAAARRAAQAAAAEAEMTKGKGRGESEKVAKGGLLRRRRKHLILILAGVIILAGGIHYARTMLPGTQQMAQPNVPAQEEPEAESSMENTEAETETVTPTRVAGAPQEAVEQIETASIDVQPPAPAEEETGNKEAVLPSTIPAEPRAQVKPPEPSLAIPKVPAEIEPVALREAAEAGNEAALYEIGNRFAGGIGVEQDMAAAARWYEKSAELGLAPAQYRIGHFYEKGTGVDRDLAKAKMWYQLAAEQGNASAMHNLAVLFAMGADGTPDNESAARWFLEAADLGVTDSQFNLGILVAKGVGTRRDLVEAYKWFDIVAGKGDTDAAAKRDEIAQLMAPADLAKAQGKAKLWEAREVDPEANLVDIPDEWLPEETITGSIDMKKAITNVQLILNKYGYDAGPPDGVLGERTRAAIKAFQKENGMAETGELDATVVRALLERDRQAG